MSKETEFKEYDIIAGDGYYWLVIENNEDLKITSVENLPDYREGCLAINTTYSLEPEMYEKSSLREYFNHIYGGDLYKEVFAAGYKALLGDIKQPKEYTDKIVDNAFNEWLKNK